MTPEAQQLALKRFGEVMGQRILNAAMLFGETAMDDMLEVAVQLEADNARLRALTLKAEWEATESSSFCDDPPDHDPACPWCHGTQPLHEPDCPAFSAPGVVR